MSRDRHGNWIGISEGKGKQGENCNRTACQEPKSAHFYNTATRAWYCEDCAYKIEASARHFDKTSLFEGLDERTLRMYKP
jgi:ribosomal protein L37AE/L43A